MKKSTTKYLTWSLLILGPATALFMTPQFSYDPINIPKFSVLVTIGFIVLFLLISESRTILKNLPRFFIIASLVFLAQMSLVLIFSGSPFSQQFYGVIGRHTGYLAYFSLVIISLGAAVVTNDKNSEKFVYGLIGSGFVTACYSLIQTMGLDPVNWNNPYNSILGFLGNPNFASSFLAISAVATSALLIKSQFTWTGRGLSLIIITTNLFLIIRSQSRQGLLVFAAGFAIVLWLYLIQNRNKFSNFVLVSYSVLASTGIAILILGSLKLGPLADLLYKLSVRQRGYYWHAAYEMIKKNPIFGVGLDGYGNWYFEERSANAAFTTPTVSSNAAHNVFLDLGANGGIILMFVYISMVIFTLYSILSYLRRKKEFNWAFAALVGAWVGYIAQSIISINQLGLATYGWLLMGCIVGMEFKDRKKADHPVDKIYSKKARNSRNVPKKKLSDSVSLLIILGLSTSSIFVYPLYAGDINYRATAKAGVLEEHIKSATTFPIFSSRITQTANYLANNGRFEDAQKLVDKAITENPRDYNAWFLKFQLAKPGTPDEKKIEKTLSQLNPKVKIIK